MIKKLITILAVCLFVPTIALAGLWSSLFGNAEIPIRLGASVLHEIYGGTGTDNYTVGDILISTSTDDLGKLAIGANDEVLTVAGGVPSWAAGGGGSGSNWEFNGTNAITPTSTVGLIINAPSTFLNDLTVGTSTTPSLYVDSGGNVGIGTNNPSSELEISKVGTVDFKITALDVPSDVSLSWIREGDGYRDYRFLNSGGYFYIEDSRNDGDTWAKNMQIYPRLFTSFYYGVGVDTQSPDRTLDVLDDSNPQIRLTHSDGSVYVDMRATSTGDWIVTSNLGQLLKTNTTDNNITLGENAGTILAAGSALRNTVFGRDALASAINSNGTVAVGFQALEDFTGEEGGVTAVGAYALSNSTEGRFNTAFGWYSQNENIDGDFNASLGTEALRLNTASNKNMAIGHAAARNVMGEQNVAMGYYAMRDATDVDRNIGLGSESLRNLADGSDRNIGIGYKTGITLDTGDDNVFIGDATGFYAYDSFRNTFIGTSAGKGGASYTGEENIFVGYQAGDNITTGDNNIILGYNIDLPIASESNQLSIGNLIFGTGIDGTGTSISSGNIGIATSTPEETLVVSGDTILAGDLTFQQTINATSGLAFGGIYLHEGNVTVELTEDEYVPIGGMLENGYNNTTLSSSTIQTDIAGTYYISYSISGDTVGSNETLDIDLFHIKDGVSTELPVCSARRKFGAAADVGNVASSCIATAHSGDQFNIRIKNTDSSADIDIFNYSFTIFQIGSNGN